MNLLTALYKSVTKKVVRLFLLSTYSKPSQIFCTHFQSSEPFLLSHYFLEMLNNITIILPPNAASSLTVLRYYLSKLEK